ncbi:hypothetical protein [Streptomyces sp. NPDC057496]|uniref:hypothetical protein n=1 Tax=Streptomyces sp. NPDC057496 TaxID=3346149 RepID=UPI0036ADA821
MSRTRSVEPRSTPSGAIQAFFRGRAGRVADNAPGARPVEDRLISGLQSARTLLGLVAAVWLVVAYPLSSGKEDFVVGKIVELAIACGILAIGSLIGITAFLVASTPERRTVFAARLGGPVVSVVALVIGPLTFWVSLLTLKGDLITGADLKDFFSSITGTGVISSVLAFLALAVGWLVSFVVLLASVPYTLVTTYFCVFTCFQASRVHQLLPALLSPLLVWSLFTFQLLNGPDVAAPPEVLYTFMLGGPVTVTVLSVWEVRRLRSRHGITLRVALGR